MLQIRKVKSSSFSLVGLSFAWRTAHFVHKTAIPAQVGYVLGKKWSICNVSPKPITWFALMRLISCFTLFRIGWIKTFWCLRIWPPKNRIHKTEFHFLRAVINGTQFHKSYLKPIFGEHMPETSTVCLRSIYQSNLVNWAPHVSPLPPSIWWRWDVQYLQLIFLKPFAPHRILKNSPTLGVLALQSSEFHCSRGCLSCIGKIRAPITAAGAFLV